MIHTGEKPYKCSKCSHSSSHTSALVNHRMTHTDEKPYKCSECSYSSSRKSNLVNHQMTHIGKKPYQRNDIGKNSHFVHKTHRASNDFQNGSVRGPIFVKPLPFVKPLKFVKPLNLSDPFLSSSSLSPSSFSSNQPESHKSHPAAFFTSSPGESVFTPAPTVPPTFSTTSPSP